MVLSVARAAHAPADSPDWRNGTRAHKDTKMEKKTTKSKKIFEKLKKVQHARFGAMRTMPDGER